ncbi:pentatricopeptide repeat-containing protein At2g35030, mitochondrial-like [Pistacia vera]|uniref:pentatricopeptide repeat-containing protein At2g35030, mitochondrial-like n=1 Tax=Pistacia vera TaxID=55513 RepID=UPI001263A1BF|nr:pentatricopeptide repeat-containing protein At2g35030, mitochondrial-like [Pistacia vera]
MSLFRYRRHLSKFPALFSYLARSNLSFSFSSHTKQKVSSTRVRPTSWDVYNYNNKICHLGRTGQVKEARKLFDEMRQRDTVSYASMITVYLKNNCLPKAEKLFLEMPEINIVAESAMISGYVKVGRVDDARKIFDQMLERNVYSWTSLISGYFKVGQVDEGRRLFDQMPEKNVVSWTTVVLGYAHNGLIDQARDIFDQMPERNVVAWTAMIKSYIDNAQINEALNLFHKMPEKNLYSWNIMVSGCLNAKRVDEAFQFFNLMPQKNAVSWTTMVTGLARNGMAKLARDYFNQMPKKDIVAWNAMITAYVDEGDMVQASEIFTLMPQRNIATWNVMIDGYARNGLEGEALKLLNLMLHSRFMPDETTITSVLTSCQGMLELTQAHALAIHLGFDHETSLSNALVTMYSRIGDVNSARLAFEYLDVKDVVSWTAMILAYSNHGYSYHVLPAFVRMLKAGVKPDEITFIGVLSGCSHVGLVEKGQKLFNSMSHAYGLKPRAEHYSCLVDILGRAGQVEEAMKVVCQMPPDECDVAVLGALLGACRLHGNVRIADEIGEKLIELEPTSSGSYILLANVYAACGEWDEFAKVRKKMKEKNVKKVPGFSQIEVKGKSHLFFVGDRSHPQVEEIYGLLRQTLLPTMRDMGYKQEKPSLSV